MKIFVIKICFYAVSSNFSLIELRISETIQQRLLVLWEKQLAQHRVERLLLRLRSISGKLIKLHKISGYTKSIGSAIIIQHDKYS